MEENSIISEISINEINCIDECQELKNIKYKSLATYIVVKF